MYRTPVIFFSSQLTHGLSEVEAATECSYRLGNRLHVGARDWPAFFVNASPTASRHQSPPARLSIPAPNTSTAHRRNVCSRPQRSVGTYPERTHPAIPAFRRRRRSTERSLWWHRRTGLDRWRYLGRQQCAVQRWVSLSGRSFRASRRLEDKHADMPQSTVATAQLNTPE